ncbi:hypothetical protein [Oceanobacillus sojae]|uniref:hypothetical protein n=1 Tax=Oceanobacillus sojae TaxID=582851 RepID=UPI003627C15D
MTEVKRYKVTYKQSFMGEVLVDSYIRVVQSDRELVDIEDALYSDPHVFSVNIEAINEEETKWKK